MNRACSAVVAAIVLLSNAASSAAPPPAPIVRIDFDAQLASQAKTYAPIAKLSFRLLRALSPTARAKVISAARAVVKRFAEAPAAGAKPLDPQTVAGQAAVQANLSGADIEALAFIVLMQATSDADKDLKDILAEVKALNEAKEHLRELTSRLNRKPTVAELFATVQPTAAIPKSAIDAAAASLHGNVDSLSEMSEMESLRLQLAMDRRSKFLETLSNIMKKISATDDSLVSSLK